MNWEIAVSIVSLLLGGGGVTAYFKLREKKLTVKSSQSFNSQKSMHELYQLMLNENAELRSRNDAYQKEIMDLRNEVLEIKSRINLIESAHSDLPIPHCIKDLKGVILQMNQSFYESFVDPFNVSFSKSIGSTDHDIFPRKTAELFSRLGRKVNREKTPISSIEEIEIGGEGAEFIEHWYVTIYPVFHKNVMVAQGFVAYPNNIKEGK
jgi:uncharacterized protein YeeX (DUF496 family)